MSKKKRIHNPYWKLKGLLCEKGVTYAQLGRLLGITATTVSQKINGYSDFYLSEIQKIKDLYGVSNDIFYNDCCS